MKQSARIVRRLIASASVAALLAGCGGGGGSHAVPTVSGNGNTSGGGPVASSSTRTLVLSPKFTSLAKQTSSFTSGQLVMHVVVNMKNPTGLASYAAGASNPKDARYRQFLTPQQIADQYGASVSDYQTVAKYFASYGLRVGMWPQRLALTVAGATTKFQNALGTTFANYKTPEGVSLIGPTGTLHLTQALPIRTIADVVSGKSRLHADYVRGSSGGPSTNASSAGYTPLQVATAFDFTGAYNAGFTGKNINIGIVGTGPIMQQDFTTFKSTYGWTGAANLTQMPVSPAAAANTWNGGVISFGGSPTATPPPVTAYCTAHDNPNLPASESPTATCNPEDFEAQIDTASAALARDANLMFYLAYVPSECYDPSGTSCSANANTGYGYTAQGLAESDDEIQQAIADNTVDVLSLSYGGADPINGVYYAANPDFLPCPQPNPNNVTACGQNIQYDPSAFGPSEFAALASEGIAVFVSSGDAGAYGCAQFSVQAENDPCVEYPGSDVSVTAVGGATVPLNNAGQYQGPITTWGEQTNGTGASTGGQSSFIPAPSWQTGPGVATGNRNVPDASMLGDPETGISIVSNSAFGGAPYGVLSQWGGTSVAAPEMAAEWALVLDACRQTPACNKSGGAHSYRLGNAAPYLWNIYAPGGGANFGPSYASVFYDVLFGNNGITPCAQNGSCSGSPTPTPGFQAGQGYDYDTGIGVPFARHLISVVVGV